MELAELDSRANLLEASLATSQEGGVATPSNSPVGKMQDGHTFPPCCGILSQTLFSTQCLLLGFLPARLGKEKSKSHSNDNSLPQQRWLRPHDHCVELLQKSLTSPSLCLHTQQQVHIKNKVKYRSHPSGPQPQRRPRCQLKSFLLSVLNYWEWVPWEVGGIPCRGAVSVHMGSECLCRPQILQG